MLNTDLLCVSPGRPWWRECGELSLLSEPLYGPVAERSQIHSYYSGYEEVSAVPIHSNSPIVIFSYRNLISCCTVIIRLDGVHGYIFHCSVSCLFVITVCLKQRKSVHLVILLTFVTVSLSHIRVLCLMNNKTCERVINHHWPDSETNDKQLLNHVTDKFIHTL